MTEHCVDPGVEQCCALKTGKSSGSKFNRGCSLSLRSYCSRISWMSEIVDEFNGAGSGRFEAPVSNPQDIKEEKGWVHALNSGDCNRLLKLLHDHPLLWRKTGRGDRTVLHVAVMKGCVKLVNLVLHGPPLVNGNQLQEFQENLKEILYAKDGRCRANAFQLSTIVGNQEVIQVLNTAARQLGSRNGSTPDDIGSSNASTNLDSSLEAEIIDLLTSSELHESLQKQMKNDVDYNFEEQRKGLIFNFACKKAHSNIVFLRSVASKAREKPILLQKLFTQMDAQGRTPLHVAVDFCKGDELSGIQELLQLMPDDCVNGCDDAGRTPLLRATANGMNLEASEVVKVLADEKRTDLNAEWPGGSGATALHLAVLHGHGLAARFVLEAQRDKLEDCADVEKIMSLRRIKVFNLQWYLKWTPLELAAVMGRHSVLNGILQSCRKPRKAPCDQRCLHLAAAAGDPRSIQTLLLNRSNDLQNFESNHNFRGYSCLHFAVFASLPHQRCPGVKPAIDEAFDRFLAFSDFASVFWLEQELTWAEKKGSRKYGMPVPGYGGKKMCTTLLLQAGVDIWPNGNFLKAAKDSLEEDSTREKDSTRDGEDFQPHSLHIPPMPDPGSDASDEARIWWFELVAKETLEAKNSFNAAGNATAVVAALVATASFIGPLTPPLGYGSDASSSWTWDGVQMASLPVRVFMVSNSLSFYFAIASIMLAIMPSLPMPQEGLREELHRGQRTVALAISVLLLSISGLLVSFTSCLIAVLPQHQYWSYTFYPAFVGWITCGVVIFLFSVRLLRLVFSRNAGIRRFYRFIGIL